MLTAHLSGPRIGERRAIGTCSCFSCLIAALRTATAMTVCLAAVETNFKSVMNREAGRTLPCSATIAKRLAAHEGLLHCVQASQFKVLASALTSIQTCTPCSTCRSSNTSNHTSDIDVDTAANEQCLNRVADFGSAWNLWCAIGNAPKWTMCRCHKLSKGMFEIRVPENRCCRRNVAFTMPLITNHHDHSAQSIHNRSCEVWVTDNATVASVTISIPSKVQHLCTRSLSIARATQGCSAGTRTQ
jgi:hypothetical protein